MKVRQATARAPSPSPLSPQIIRSSVSPPSRVASPTPKPHTRHGDEASSLIFGHQRESANYNYNVSLLYIFILYFSSHSFPLGFFIYPIFIFSFSCKMVCYLHQQHYQTSIKQKEVDHPHMIPHTLLTFPLLNEVVSLAKHSVTSPSSLLTLLVPTPILNNKPVSFLLFLLFLYLSIYLSSLRPIPIFYIM